MCDWGGEWVGRGAGTKLNVAFTREYPANRRPRRWPSGCASRLHHPLNAGIHFFFFDEFASFNLVDSNLYLLLEQFAMGEQSRDGFLHQIVGPPACFRGKLVQLSFLILR